MHTFSIFVLSHALFLSSLSFVLRTARWIVRERALGVEWRLYMAALPQCHWSMKHCSVRMFVIAYTRHTDQVWRIGFFSTLSSYPSLSFNRERVRDFTSSPLDELQQSDEMLQIKRKKTRSTLGDESNSETYCMNVYGFFILRVSQEEFVLFMKCPANNFVLCDCDLVCIRKNSSQPHTEMSG